jgi:hypothetical protein
MIARQPFTFGGVARFSTARVGRVSFVALVFGLVSGLVVSWLCATCLAPVVDEAVSKLPQTGSIERGVLLWPEKSGRLLAANSFISFDVALQDHQAEGAPVDFSVRFRTNDLALTSLLGTTRLPYPPFSEFEFNHISLSPAWGAWRVPLLVALIPGTALLLMLTWAALALIYSPLPLLIGTAFNREVGFLPAWKLSVAAQLPGSLMMAFALALYSTGKIALIFVLVMLLAHFIPTFIYLLISPFLIPKSEQTREEPNPFEGEKRRKTKGKNPFAEGKR